MRLYGTVYLLEEKHGGHDPETEDRQPDYAHIGEAPVDYERHRNEQDKEAPYPHPEHSQYPGQHPSVPPRVSLLRCSNPASRSCRRTDLERGTRKHIRARTPDDSGTTKPRYQTRGTGASLEPQARRIT